MKSRFRKATNKVICKEYLQGRLDGLLKKGFSKPKWMMFCETMLERGFKVSLYEARQTVSKYVTVIDAEGRRFKVRFSNHKPIKAREVKGDCDFFVGITNLSVTRTENAIDATLAFFRSTK